MDNLMLRRRLMMAAQGVWTTVTATTPFSVQNALKSKMQSLIQYGKMVQDGTPTPDAPVWPSINNGTVRMVDPDLPAGYKRLTGLTLESARFETDIILTGASTLRFSASGKSGNWIGAYQTADVDNNYSFYASANANGKYLRYDGETYNSSIVIDTRYDITITPTGVTGSRTPSTWSQKAFVCAYPVSIGATSPGANPAPNVTFYGSIFADDVEIIPCERESDGTLGYFVNGAFLTDTAGGTVTSLGYDTNHLVLGVDGTPEVLTVGGRNLANPALVDGEGWYIVSGKIANSAAANRTIVFPCKPNTTYSWWHCDGVGGMRAFESDTATPTVGDTAAWAVGSPAYKAANVVTTYTTSATAKYLIIDYSRRDSSSTRTHDEQFADFMLVEGAVSEALPYEPYRAPQTVTVPDLFAVGGYKDEADIISGVVTRNVGCKVLDGTEAWTKLSGVNAYFTEIAGMKVCNPVEAGFSTHFIGTAAATSSMPDGSVKLTYTSTPSGAISIRYNASASTANFKAYLAAQYAAGTPVVVWYPLATPTTESITPQELSTVKGANVIDATSDIAPFDVSVTYRARK